MPCKGQVFRGVVARFANSENEQKLMRTEVDLPNPDNRLRDGMYGTATLELEPPSKNLSIPSSCLIEQDGQGEGAVYVVRDGKAHRQAVRVGLDNGSEVEIVEGLNPDDQVDRPLQRLDRRGPRSRGLTSRRHEDEGARRTEMKALLAISAVFEAGTAQRCRKTVSVTIRADDLALRDRPQRPDRRQHGAVF